MTVQIANVAPLKRRGRIFSIQDIKTIISCVDEHYDAGRTKISKEVCEKLNWKQPNGWLKDRACRDVLRYLDEIKIIDLPPSKSHGKGKSNKQQSKVVKDFLLDYDLQSPVDSFPKQLDFIFAKGNQEELVWNAVVNTYHYLGHSTTVGRSIKYLIMSDSRIIAAISFASPAWNIHSRNQILNALGIEEIREHTINNSRFLIAPGIHVKNLASHILAQATKRIVEDWASYYCIKPLVAETFVQPSRFDGTCYKAANWVKVGVTQGYAKRGLTYRNSQEQKHIFLYGLEKSIRKQLALYKIEDAI